MDYNWDCLGVISPVTNQLANPTAHLSIDPKNSQPGFILGMTSHFVLPMGRSEMT